MSRISASELMQNRTRLFTICYIGEVCYNMISVTDETD